MHHARIPAACAALALTAGALTACSGTSGTPIEPAARQSATRTVDTAFGPVTIPVKPQRPIALEGGIGPLLAAGATPLATADGNSPDNLLPDEYAKVKSLPIILGADGIDAEKIAALKPDMMIGFVRGGKEAELSPKVKAEWQKLNAIAPTVMIRSDGSAKTKDATNVMMEALGQKDAADRAKKAYEDKAAQIRTTYKDVLAKHTFAALDFYEEVYVYSPISWPGDTITDAGGKLTAVSAKETKENATFLSAEQLGRVGDATVVLHDQTVDGKPGQGATDLAKLPTFAALPAVKAGNNHGLRYFFADRYTTALESLNSFEGTLKKLKK